MKIAAIDPGFAHYGIAIMEFKITNIRFCLNDVKWRPIRLAAFHTLKSTKKRAMRVSDDDSQRITAMVMSVDHILEEYRVNGALVEIPSGAQSYNALKAMSFAHAMTVAMLELRRIPWEGYSNGETRKAIKKQGKVSKSDAIRIMSDKFPELHEIDLIGDAEHIADALATFLAGRNGNLIKMLEKEN